MLKVASSVINASQITTPITFVGDVTLSTGNLVIGTSGKGIDFSATSSGSGTMTSELLADYEEGTWTPAIVMDSGTSTGGTFSGFYTKIGRQVTLTISANVGTVASSPTIGGFSNLPFTSIDDLPIAVGSLRENANTGNMFEWRVNRNLTTSFVARYDNNAVVSNGDTFLGTVTYFV